MKIEGYGSRSISQRHGSADPDPHQNVMDPQHCKSGSILAAKMVSITPSPSVTSSANREPCLLAIYKICHQLVRV
jgi:hypothetical protein